MHNIRFEVCSAFLSHLLAPTCTHIMETCRMTFQCINGCDLWFLFCGGNVRSRCDRRTGNILEAQETTQESNNHIWETPRPDETHTFPAAQSQLEMHTMREQLNRARNLAVYFRRLKGGGEHIQYRKSSGQVRRFSAALAACTLTCLMMLLVFVGGRALAIWSYGATAARLTRIRRLGVRISLASDFHIL